MRGRRAKALDVETQGARSQNKGLTRKITQLDERVLKQQETLYRAEFAIQNLERRVARAGGARSRADRGEGHAGGRERQRQHRASLFGR